VTRIDAYGNEIYPGQVGYQSADRQVNEQWKPVGRTVIVDVEPKRAQLLTHSRQDTFKTCRKKHFFSYELGLRPVTDAKALRMGAAYHDALENLETGGTLDSAVELVRTLYGVVDAYDQTELDYECETVLRLVCGYVWRWESYRLEFIAAELPFEIPLRNPETGGTTPNFLLAGKIDGIVKLDDGRLAVIEHKLLSEDVASDSQLWRRLRMDHQISMYVLAARKLGYPVDAVLYNVSCKPSIKPTLVPVLDRLGAKIVLDKYGDRVKTEKGCYRQTGDTNKGYVLQTRPMLADEWGEKLANDIVSQPDRYYARMEIPRLDQDLEEYENELWDIQRTIRDAQLNNRHFRTCNKNTCGFCSYFDICSAGFDHNSVPSGFVRLSDVNPELGRTNVNVIAPGTTAEETTYTAPF